MLLLILLVVLLVVLLAGTWGPWPAYRRPSPFYPVSGGITLVLLVLLIVVIVGLF